MNVSDRATKVDEELARLILSPRAYAEQTALYAGFRRLRATNPVGRVEVDGYDPFWAVTKHADILEVAGRMTCSAIATTLRLFGHGRRTTCFVRCVAPQIRFAC